MKILIIQAKKGMGDMVIYLPYIRQFQKNIKKVSILAKNNSRAKDLLAEDDHIDEIITLEEKMDGLKGIFNLTNELKKEILIRSSYLILP